MNKFAFLKNAVDLIAKLVDVFDGAINESCHQYKECDTYLPFTNADKPVLATEYKGKFNKICKKAEKLKFHQLVFDKAHKGHWKSCP